MHLPNDLKVFSYFSFNCCVNKQKQESTGDSSTVDLLLSRVLTRYFLPGSLTNILVFSRWNEPDEFASTEDIIPISLEAESLHVRIQLYR